MHQTKPIVLRIKHVHSLVFFTSLVTVIHPRGVKYHVVLLLVSGCFKVLTLLPFFLPTYLHALILPVPLLPDNQTGPSGLLASAHPLWIHAENNVSETQIWSISGSLQPVQEFPGFTLESLATLNYTMQFLTSAFSIVTVSHSPLGWSLLSLADITRHPLLFASLPLLLYSWAACHESESLCASPLPIRGIIYCISRSQ